MERRFSRWNFNCLGFVRVSETTRGSFDWTLNEINLDCNDTVRSNTRWSCTELEYQFHSWRIYLRRLSGGYCAKGTSRCAVPIVLKHADTDESTENEGAYAKVNEKHGHCSNEWQDDLRKQLGWANCSCYRDFFQHLSNCYASNDSVTVQTQSSATYFVFFLSTPRTDCSRLGVLWSIKKARFHCNNNYPTIL